MYFLKYTGETEQCIDGDYKFLMRDPPHLYVDSFIEVTSPVLDNSFQTIIGQNAEIAKDLLNSIIYPEDKKIKKIEYLKTNFPGEIGTQHSLGSIRTDVLCKCIIEGEDELIVDLEMQIFFSRKNTLRFIKFYERFFN